MYTIIEAHCIFENNQLKEVAVLWDDNGAVRATCITNTPCAGYDFITSRDSLTPQLLQKAAGGGSYIDEKRRARYFPGKRRWSR